MQKEISLPERGWSKFNRVDGGYGINRSFSDNAHFLPSVIYLPSRREINEFISQYVGDDFTSDELRDFSESNMMTGDFFDSANRVEPSPQTARNVHMTEKWAEFLTPADVIDSWLRTPLVWDASNIKDEELGNDEGIWKHLDVVGPKVSFSYYSAPDIAVDTLYPSSSLSIAKLSLIMRRFELIDTLFAVLDMHRIPLSVIERICRERFAGNYLRTFESLHNQWVVHPEKLSANLKMLTISNGVLVNPSVVEWLFSMPHWNIPIEDAQVCIEREIAVSDLILYVSRGIAGSDAILMIENDIDPELASATLSSGR